MTFAVRDAAPLYHKWIHRLGHMLGAESTKALIEATKNQNTGDFQEKSYVGLWERFLKADYNKQL